jgi:hypothetical protein
MQACGNTAMQVPEATRKLAEVTIRARETRPGFFTASFQPTSPKTHLARSGFTLDTTAGVQGHNLAEVLEWAEAFWRENYPDS